ncbi:MAG: SMC family ATPase, partial [Calditrichaeota bacterium]
MIPLRLTVKGLYSYRQEQTVDFTRLTEAQLFGIFGPVGSGKSTLLEAISFALYGETERLHRRDNRYYNMMNLKASELYIEFVCRAGKDGQEYRFVVQGKRPKKNYAEVKAFKRAQYRRAGKEWEPVEVNPAELLGLSYENFRRTIIIPQGKFQEFLQLNSADRTRMLREIFHLERFELYENTRQVEQRNTEEINRLEGRLRELGEANPEVIREKEAEAAALKKTLQKLQRRLRQKEQQEADLRRLKDIGENLARQEERLRQLQEQAPAFEERRKRLATYEECRLKFGELLNRYREERRRLTVLKKEVEEKQRQEQQLSRRWQEAQKALEQIKAEYEGRERLQQEAEDLTRLLEIRDLETRMEKFRQDIEQRQKELRRRRETLKAVTADLQAASEQRKQLRQKQQEMKKLEQIREWLRERHRLQERIEELQAEAGKRNRDLQALEQHKRRLIAEHRLTDWAPEEMAALPLPELIRRVEELRGELEAGVEQLDQELEHLQVQAELSRLASTLKEGEPCPVCGSTEHPRVLRREEVEETLARTRQKRAALQERRQQADQIRARLGELFSKAELLENQHREVRRRLEEMEAEMQNHRARFVWKEFDPDDEEALQAAFEEARQIEEELNALEQKQEHLAEQQEEARNQQEALQDALNRLKQQRGEAETRRQTLLEQMQHLDLGAYRDQDKAAIQREREERWRRKAEIEKAFQERDREVQELGNRVAALRGRLEQAQQQMQAQQKTVQQLQDRLSHQLKASVYSRLEEVEEILSRELDVEGEKKAIAEFESALKSTRQLLNDLQKQMQGKTYDAGAHQRLQEEIAELKEQQQERQKTLGALEQAVQDLKQRWETRQKVEQQLEALRKRAENLKLLKSMFQGSKFVEFVASVYLRELC